MEKFVDIEGYEGNYQVSNYGNVKSIARDIVGGNGAIRHYEEKLMKPNTDKGGYLYVVLCKDGKMKTCKIHRLVAQSFIPNQNNYPQINHKDEDKTNNRVENLEWCDSKYNNNYGTHNKRMAERIAEVKSKQVYQYSLDGELVAIWSSTSEAGRNGFNKGHISDCCNNKYLREGNNEYKCYRWSYTPLS